MHTQVNGDYDRFFRFITGHHRHDYQARVAGLLFGGRNILLRVPTGAGKTWSALTPFLHDYWQAKSQPLWKARPAQLIYALPLRTLAQGVYEDARAAAKKLGMPLQSRLDGDGREVERPFVTLQTGEQPDDPFFDRGRIIVTTYDQLLSGLLSGPYGLSDRLNNINAASVAGALVVFDEFHLMESRRAFLTAVAMLRMFLGLCQSVWMTATATEPLEAVLRDALDVAPVPEGREESERLWNCLPSITSVTRHLTVHPEPISAEAVWEHHRQRSIVILNTVSRAQEMRRDLKKFLNSGCDGVEIILLHSRFFRGDRRSKEERLRTLFGRTASRNAILIATQVIEAGLDLSCEHLHTELCPMNALVQRAGRCARFEDQAGMVHVYELPEQPKAWLPYGDDEGESATLAATRKVLRNIRCELLHPRVTGEWVQQVHAVEDKSQLERGWKLQFHECLGRIQQNVIVGDSKRIADLIRGENTDQVRVIVRSTNRLPESPAKAESFTLSRRSLYRLIEGGTPVAFLWNPGKARWEPLAGRAGLSATYAVALSPSVAAYDSEVGLRLMESGIQESPDRNPPPRPGHGPLHKEEWTVHSLRVAEEGQRRLDHEHWSDGLLGTGFEFRYGLSRSGLADAVRACGLLHDLGKLQADWQRWAEAAQRERDPSYEHRVPLAHTDFDRTNPIHREAERRVRVQRPPHSACSLYYGRAFLPQLLPHVPEALAAYIASACGAAIVSHHGGWWTPQFELSPPPLYSGWRTDLSGFFGQMPSNPMWNALKRCKVHSLLNAAAGPDTLHEWWPLVSYLMRTLRLSDQKATSENGYAE